MTDELKMTEKRVFVIEYGDLEQFVAEKYCLGFFSITEVSNDTLLDIGSYKKKELDNWDQETLDKILKQESANDYELFIVFKDMVNKGLFPEDREYQVNVSW